MIGDGSQRWGDLCNVVSEEGLIHRLRSGGVSWPIRVRSSGLPSTSSCISLIGASTSLGFRTVLGNALSS